MKEDSPSFIFAPDAEHPGWRRWDATDNTRFNQQVLGTLLARKEEGPGAIPMLRLRMFPETRHSNMMGNVHGGTIMALSDVILFAAFHVLSAGDAEGAVTLDMSHQFLGAGTIDHPLDAVAEILRETGRLVFLRGMIEQGDNRIAAFSATVRKGTRTDGRNQPARPTA